MNFTLALIGLVFIFSSFLRETKNEKFAFLFIGNMLLALYPAIFLAVANTVYFYLEYRHPDAVAGVWSKIRNSSNGSINTQQRYAVEMINELNTTAATEVSRERSSREDAYDLYACLIELDTVAFTKKLSGTAGTYYRVTAYKASLEPLTQTESL